MYHMQPTWNPAMRVHMYYRYAIKNMDISFHHYSSQDAAMLCD